VTSDPAEPWNDQVGWAVCDRTIIPRLYSIPARDPRGPDPPRITCPGYGQRYRWQGSAGRGPVDNS
jgi:hypothetical protein